MQIHNNHRRRRPPKWKNPEDRSPYRVVMTWVQSLSFGDFKVNVFANGRMEYARPEDRYRKIA